MSFTAPVNAIHYLLRHATDFEAIQASDKYGDASHDLVGDILSGSFSFSQNVLAPINQNGDHTPARLDDDNVIASPGFKDAYAQYVEGGWQALTMPEAVGGMGLPQVVGVAASEMQHSANMAFGLCPMLTQGSTNAILAHGSDELKEKYLPKMVSGEWTGAMDLTEPQAGSDLGVLRSKAEPNGDGTYAITGQKIYITWGDHDCADNIIHLVLARLPDAPAGSRGISLFLCPKYFVNDDGSLGERNNFRPIGLEHKLGIHGSPTCVMGFEGATGWLVGEPNKGLACMFTMMNEARLYVGVQGVAIGERAYQAALGYAKDRVQGRVIDVEGDAPIIGHPDVRRMLIDMKTRLMGARTICMNTAAAGDLASISEGDAAKAAHVREALLTPIAKAYGSDIGVDVASIGIQIHGGMGFVEETGAAQHYRDARIAPIYEGTNGIQALDLIGRKLRRDGGEGMRALIADLESILSLAGQADGLDVCERALKNGIETLKTATDIVLNATEKDAMAGATNYLKLCGDVVSGAFLIKAAANGLIKGDALADNMAQLARYHALAILPQAASQLEYMRSGASTLFDFPEMALADL